MPGGWAPNGRSRSVRGRGASRAGVRPALARWRGNQYVGRRFQGRVFGERGSPHFPRGVSYPRSGRAVSVAEVFAGLSFLHGTPTLIRRVLINADPREVLAATLPNSPACRFRRSSFDV